MLKKKIHTQKKLANSDLLMEAIDGGNCNLVERMARCWHSLLLPEVQSRCYKSFVICTVYRPPSTPLNFMDDLANSLIESLLSGLDVIILGDLNCNLLQDNAESRALNDFCSTFNLTQLINKPDVYRFLGNRVRFFSVGPEYQFGPDFV